MRQRAAASDVVIVNHHLLCADAAVRQSAYGEVIPECSHAIIDEAHQLEDVATQYFGRRSARTGSTTWRATGCVCSQRTWSPIASVLIRLQPICNGSRTMPGHSSPASKRCGSSCRGTVRRRARANWTFANGQVRRGGRRTHGCASGAGLRHLSVERCAGRRHRPGPSRRRTA